MIIAVICILASAWFAWHTKRASERKLQKCMDTYESSNDLRNSELQGAIHRADEAMSALAAAKKTLENLRQEYETLKNEFEAYMALHDPHAGNQDPVDGGQPTYHDHPGEPAGKQDKLLNFRVTEDTDFSDIKKSYDELAKSYHYVSQRFENPSKTYLVRNIVRAYNVDNISQLAKALGVRPSSISQMLK